MVSGRKQGAVIESVVPTAQFGGARGRLIFNCDLNVQLLAVPSAGRLELTLTWSLGNEGKCVVCNEF